MQEKIDPISEVLVKLTKNLNEDSYITIGEINHILLDRGFGLMMILFAFPMAIPLPYPPGFTAILGTPLLFFAIQMLLGRKKPYLPKWLADKKLKVSHLNMAINKTNKYFKKMEALLKPRLSFLANDKGERFIGFVSCFCAVSIILPIWFGNAIPSLGIVIMAFGMLEKDGLCIIIGHLISIIGLFISTLVVILGVKAFTAILNKLINFIL